MKKVLLSLIIMISIGISIHAQDEAVYSQYIFHPILVNPAYAGFKQQHELIFNFKMLMPLFQVPLRLIP